MKDYLLWGFLCAIGCIIFLTLPSWVKLEPSKGEHITEQQYRAQSLQYLEDIRNALDEQ